MPAEAVRGLLYLDSSALVKLVLPENETEALSALLRRWRTAVSSVVSEIEVVRATRRASADVAAERRARELLAGIYLVELDSAVRSTAAVVEPNGLKSLDAIHLASALSLGPDLGEFVVYDVALGRAARSLGLPVVSPR